MSFKLNLSNSPFKFGLQIFLLNINFIIQILYFEFLLSNFALILFSFRIYLTTSSLVLHILNFAFKCCLFNLGFILPFLTFHFQILLFHLLILSFELCLLNFVFWISFSNSLEWHMLNFVFFELCFSISSTNFSSSKTLKIFSLYYTCIPKASLLTLQKETLLLLRWWPNMY